MKHKDIDNRVRPGFIIVLVAVLAVISITVWKVALAPVSATTIKEPAAKERSVRAKPNHHNKRAEAPVATNEQTATAEPAAEEQPAAVAESTPVIIPSPPNGKPSTFEEQWGIRMSVAKLIGNGATLELQYLLVDTTKTARLTDEQSTPYLIDQASGAKVMLCVPLHKDWPYANHSRARSMAMIAPGAGGFPPASGKQIVGRTYSLIVANPDLALKKGSQAVIAVGDIRSDVLTVQ
jgi:hypothetical protein